MVLKVVSELTSLGELIKMQIIKPHPRFTESKTWGWCSVMHSLASSSGDSNEW